MCVAKQADSDNIAGRDSPVQIEVTPQMKIEGACLLEAWLDRSPGDPELYAMSTRDVVVAICGRMMCCHYRQYGTLGCSDNLGDSHLP